MYLYCAANKLGRFGMDCGITRKTSHQTACKKCPGTEKVQAPNIRVRPQRVAARRQNELLCLLEMQEMEWLPIDEVEIENVGDISLIRNATSTPVMSMDRESVSEG